ncbi:MAG: hypothetical protein IJJ74_10095 [Eubacterium sp.]|nr:hypothetical protein [Eubacterium sp.]
MNKRFLFVVIVLLTVTGIASSLYIMKDGNDIVAPDHTTEINRHLLYLKSSWDEISSYDSRIIAKDKSYDYAIIDVDGRLLVYTKDKIAKTLTAATSDYDIIRDIEVDGKIVGRLIVDNVMLEKLDRQNIILVIVITITILVIMLIVIIYYYYIYRTVVKPAREQQKAEEKE